MYKIYNSSGTEVAAITTDSSGKGTSNVKLKNGTYTAVESKMCIRDSRNMVTVKISTTMEKAFTLLKT